MVSFPKIWLVWKYLFARREFFDLTGWLSILGIAIGVASLFVSMSVFSGYESTLKQSIIGREGHITVLKGEKNAQSKEEDIRLLTSSIDGIKNITPFIYLEALLVHQKKLSGILIHGIDPKSFESVLDLKKRLIKGQFEFEEDSKKKTKKNSKRKVDGKFQKENQIKKALLGKALAKKYQLEIGDIFKLIVPQKESNHRFSPQFMTLQVNGLLDYGVHDYNERSLVISFTLAEHLNNHSNATGFHIKLNHEKKSKEITKKINDELHPLFWARNWTESDKVLFEVIKLEKIVIFFILLLMIIASGFNVSSTLFTSVMEKVQDISLFKALGANNRFILYLFSFQGLLIGMIGVFLGIGLGIFICYSLLSIQDSFGILVSDVYNLEMIDLEFRLTDLMAILFSTLFICFIATLIPAYKGIKLSPSEGLKFD